MSTSIRKFIKEDIPYKVKWINDKRNNKYLHYDLPLREDKTLKWYERIKNRTDRADFTITFNNKPVGLIGLLNIDTNEKNAEYYICVGEHSFKGKGVATEATDLLLKKAYNEYHLKKIYLYTEIKNVRAQKLFERIGFSKIKLLKNHLFYNDRNIDRYLYELDLEYYLNNKGD